MNNEPNRRREQRSFWDQKSVENAHFHILGDDRMWTESEVVRDRAFEEAGRLEAVRLGSYLHPESQVVDLGCGIGRLMRPLSELARSIQGYDISEEMLTRGRDYLAGVKNTKLQRTSGAELSQTQSSSVDFLYSLLCLIHVDKRSAYKYFVEISRVLKPDAICLLQVLDITSEEGFAKFESVVDSDYPLEFYSESEIRFLLGRCGLDVLRIERSIEFMNLVCIRGSAENWQSSFVNEVEISEQDASGFFVDESIGLACSGHRTLKVTNSGSSWRTFRFVIRAAVAIDDREVEVLLSESAVAVAPRSTLTMRVTKAEGQPTLSYQSTGQGRFSLLSETWTEVANGGEGGLFVALIPTGFDWGEEVASQFPGSSLCRRIDWTP